MTLTENQKKLIDILDCFFTFGMNNDVIKNYHEGSTALLKKCFAAATTLKNNKVYITTVTQNNKITDKSAIDLIRAYANNVVEASDKIDNFIIRAKNAGYLPPQSPMAELLKKNKARKISKSLVGDKKNIISSIFLDPNIADDMMFNLNILLKLMEMEKEGSFSFGKGLIDKSNGSQISAFGINLSAFDFVNASANSGIMSFIPDLDSVKRKRIQDVLGALDFKNRIPHILLTMNYDPDGISKGIIIVWKKMFDASGYILKKHSVFDNKDYVYNFTNEQINQESQKVKTYVENWALSFYNNLDSSKVFCFLDEDFKLDNFYTYSLTATQKIRTNTNFIFNTETTPLMLSTIQLKDIGNEMDIYVKNVYSGKIKNFDKDDINPYPFLSKRFYGNDKYDWIIAATNIKAAKDRGELKTEVRKYSYLNCKFSFIEDQISKNLCYRPKDIESIINKIKESISSFGISQTLIEIMQATGLDMFFGATEDPQDDSFKKASNVIDDVEFSTLDAILATINVETATVDIKSLSNTLLLITKGKSDLKLNETSPTEFNIIVDEKNEVADSPLQFVGNLDSVSNILDLATFEGISDFIRIIRLFFDENPDKKSFSELADQIIVPKQEILKSSQLPSGGSITTEKSKLS